MTGKDVEIQSFDRENGYNNRQNSVNLHGNNIDITKSS